MRALILAAALTGLACPAVADPAFAPPEPQSGAEVLQVLRSQGLVGIWSVNCRKLPSRENGRETITVRGSQAVAIVEEDAIFTADIVSARRVDRRDTALHLREREYGVNYYVVYRRRGDRQMTWSSMDSDGEDLIVEGRLNTGEMGEWYRRCGPAPAR